MAKTCEKCGKEHSDTSGLFSCDNCGTYYCQDCLKEIAYKRKTFAEARKIKLKEEKKRREELVHADLDTYKWKICPECELDIAPII